MSVTLEEDDDVVLGLGPDGRPDPEYARALGLVPASPGRRSAAFAIDLACVLLLTLPLTLGTFPLWMIAAGEVDPAEPQSLLSSGAFVAGLIFYIVGEALLIIFLLVQLIVHGRRGVTVGKKMVGIRSVKARGFTRPGFWRMVLRGLVFWSSLVIIPLLGAIPFLLSPLWDSQKRGRGWLDLVGGNWLIDIRRGLDPFDSKALRHARRRLEKPEAQQEQEVPSLATGVSGAVPSFVPSERSRSGVISARSDDAAAAWQPPELGEAVPVSELGSAAVAAAPVASAPPAPPASPPAPRANRAAQPRAPRAVAILTFDDGSRVPVAGSGLLGRAPVAAAGESFDHLIPVVDPERLISKIHAEFVVDARGFSLTDRNSVNGVEVAEPGGAPRELPAASPQLLPWGTKVTIGGRSFTVAADPNAIGREA